MFIKIYIFKPQWVESESHLSMSLIAKTLGFNAVNLRLINRNGIIVVFGVAVIIPM